MSAAVTPRVANLALAVSVAVVVAAGMSFALFYHTPETQVGAHEESGVASSGPDSAGNAHDRDSGAVPAAGRTAGTTSHASGDTAAADLPATSPSAPPAVVPTPSGSAIAEANGTAAQPPTVATVNPAPAAAPNKIDPNVAVRVRPGDPIPPLPTVALQPHDVHGIAENDAPVLPVTVTNREGRVLDIEPDRAARTSLSGHPETSAVNPRSGARTGKATPVALESAPNLTGAAVVTATLELNVDGHPLRLYGLKAPETSDMCAPSAQFAARACPEVSREALAGLLRRDSQVECHVMAPTGGAALPATCADTRGADLGRALIARGLALAEDSAGADYAEAERQARASHLGLWQYR